MGMFDDIKCKRVMPDGFEGEWFQSKDLSCDLNTFEITDDGHLVQTGECPIEGGKQDLPTPKESDFHGWLNFYTHDKSGKWREYNAKFTDGRLVKIETANVEVQGPGAASSRTVPCNDGLAGAPTEKAK